MRVDIGVLVGFSPPSGWVCWLVIIVDFNAIPLPLPPLSTFEGERL